MSGRGPELQPPLHVTNGDSAGNTLRQTTLGGDVLSWQDVLHEGPVRQLARSQLLRERAGFLADCGWGDRDAILASLERRDREFLDGLRDRTLPWLERAQRVVVPSQWSADQVAALGGHPVVAHHGVDAEVFRPGQPVRDEVLFVGTVTPALTVLPAAIAAIAGEALRIRSWMYYVLAGGAAMAAIPVLASPRSDQLPALPASQYMTIFAAAGFVGGIVYWLLAGRNA